MKSTAPRHSATEQGPRRKQARVIDSQSGEIEKRIQNPYDFVTKKALRIDEKSKLLVFESLHRVSKFASKMYGLTANVPYLPSTIKHDIVREYVEDLLKYTIEFNKSQQGWKREEAFRKLNDTGFNYSENDLDRDTAILEEFVSNTPLYYTYSVYNTKTKLLDYVD